MRAWLMLLLAVFATPAPAETPKPPVAAKRPFMVTSPNGAREDNYYWLRDDSRKNPEMLAYIAAENAYTAAAMAPLKPLADTLYAEITGRIQQDDSTVPYLKHGYWYQTRYTPGADYPVVVRRKDVKDAPEEVLLDEPKMAAGHGFFSVGQGRASPDDRLYAYAEDTVGRRQFVLRIKEIASGRMLDDAVPDIESGLVWAADGKTILYVEKDPVTLLSSRIKAHVIGTPAAADRTIYEEKDKSFYIWLGRTTDDHYICIYAHSTVSDEQRCAPEGDPARLSLIAPRERELHYTADHIGDRWIIRTDWMAKNYRLMAVDDGQIALGREAWFDLIPASDAIFIEDFKPFSGFIAVEERSGGNKRIRLWRPGGSTFIESNEPAYAMALDVNEERRSDWVRYTYDSLTTPTTVIEANALTGERRTLKVQPVPGYDQSKYVTERVWATARDGTRVPVSLFYRKGLRKDGKAPLLQYGYGAYGYVYDPRFTSYAVSMADRGFVFALAHIRGGMEMGRGWYDDGHLLNKKNSFTDFIDVTHWLVANHYAARDKVAALGASAGGLLMGAVANMAPGDYRAIVAHVPFVDIVTTMLDASIPLTTNEYDEWGNPAKQPFYSYMLSYSPYDNVKPQAYPAMYVTSGLWDSQVQYYEPTKWVAKLRATKTDTHPLLLQMNMEAGHGGKSGRFIRYREDADTLAFVLAQMGIAK